MFPKTILILSLSFLFLAPAFPEQQEIDLEEVYGEGLLNVPPVIETSYLMTTGKVWDKANYDQKEEFLYQWQAENEARRKEKAELEARKREEAAAELKKKKEARKEKRQEAREERLRQKEKARLEREEEEKVREMKRKRKETLRRLRQLQNSRSGSSR
ncbi:MAG: hypothetical protein GX606_01265 [Elusimicrobia bacterium]|nr:hypothetical protein [Elusimicrobiota bacterium]